MNPPPRSLEVGFLYMHEGDTTPDALEFLAVCAAVGHVGPEDADGQ